MNAFTNESNGVTGTPDASDIGSVAQTGAAAPYSFWYLSNIAPITWVGVGTAGGSGYDQLQEEGVNLTQRSILDFVGEALTASDTGVKSQLLIAPYGAGGVVTQIDVGDAASGGALNQLARADHQHALPAPAAPANVDRSAASPGAATTVARADHKHDVATAVPVSVAQANAEGVAASLARSDHVHDHGIQPLGAGTQHALVTPDPGGFAGFMSPADKAKSDASGTLAVLAPVNVSKSAAVVGVGTTAARQDHKHDIDTAAAVTINATTANAEGAAATLARSDHTHAIPTAAPGTIAVGDAAAIGIAASLARSDHVHALPAPAAPVNVDKSAASAGAATTVARADHKHDISTAAPTASIDAGDAAVEGTAATLARSDHQHAVSTALVGDLAVADAAAAAAGVGTNIPRADHKHQVSTAAPTVPVRSEATAASTGVAATVLRTDAQIQALTAVPVAVGLALAQGASSALARADHVHSDVFPVLLWGNDSVSASTTTRYLTPGYDDVLAPIAVVQIRVPRGGTLRNLRVRHNTPNGNGNVIVYTVRINSVATAVTVSLASTSADGSDVTNTAAVAAGDLVDIEVTKAASVATSPDDVAATLELTP